ncbi:MAG TPA: glycosyltransferase family 4 protein [Candidatus Limnocylindrales bacterium]
MSQPTPTVGSVASPDSNPGISDRRLTLGIIGNQSSVHVQRWSEALARRGHEIVAIELAGRGRNPLQRVAAFLSLRRAMKRVARSERGIVVVHYVPGGVLAAGMRGIHPIVLHAWGADVTTEVPGQAARFIGRQIRGLFRAADSTTATSRFLADTVRRRFDVEAQVVPFGIDVERFKPAPHPRRPGVPRIGFVKIRLDAKYGPDVLIEALGLLPSDQPFELFMAGDGGLRPALEARAAELGIASRVRFLGVLPHAEIAPLLADLDIFAMPSRREEWGVAAAEASASGVPVVATRVGGIPEVVADGETGLLVPPENPEQLAAALARLIADSDLRARLGAAGRRKIEAEFRWEDCVERMERVYAGVISDAHGA